MESAVDMCASLLKPGGVLLYFCSAVQFATRHRMLSKKTETGNWKVLQTRKVFIVEGNDFTFLNRSGYTTVHITK